MIVHCKKAPFDVYIGRPAKSTPYHYGSPFAKGNVQAFDDWLNGFAHQEIEPERRLWILNRIPTLAGKTLGCWCDPDVPCHGRILEAMAAAAIDAMHAFVTPNEPLSYVWSDGKRVHISTVLDQGLSEAEQERYNRLRGEVRRQRAIS